MTVPILETEDTRTLRLMRISQEIYENLMKRGLNNGEVREVLDNCQTVWLCDFLDSRRKR